jgi:iron complex transport system ATP-binding protein
MVLHNLNLAARYADRLIAMQGGRIAADGPPAEVLTETMLAEVFGLAASVVVDPHTGGPMVVPRGGARGHGPSAAPPST